MTVRDVYISNDMYNVYRIQAVGTSVSYIPASRARSSKTLSEVG